MWASVLHFALIMNNKNNNDINFRYFEPKKFIPQSRELTNLRRRKRLTENERIRLNKLLEERDRYVRVYKKLRARYVAAKERYDRKVARYRRYQNRLIILNRNVRGIWLMVHHLRYGTVGADVHPVIARNIGSAIFDMPHQWTGYQTIDSIGMNSRERCNEHFYPRQWAGELVLNYVLQNNGITINRLYDLCQVLIQVHYTTREENNRLEVFYRKTPFKGNWEIGYNAVCSKLIQTSDNENHTILSIGDVLPDYHKYMRCRNAFTNVLSSQSGNGFRTQNKNAITHPVVCQ